MNLLEQEYEPVLFRRHAFLTHLIQLIYTTLRFVSEEELEWWLEDCIALKQEFPHIIAGQVLLFVLFVYLNLPSARVRPSRT